MVVLGAGKREFNKSDIGTSTCTRIVVSNKRNKKKCYALRELINTN